MGAVLHDPVTRTSRTVQVAFSGDRLQVGGDGVDLLVAASDLRVQGGGWDGRAVHLLFTHEGQPYSVTLDAETVRTLRAAAPSALADELDRLTQAGGRSDRRGRLTLPLVVFVCVVLPLTALVALFLARERLVDAALRRLPASVDTQLGDLVHRQLQASGRLRASGADLAAVRAVGERLVAAAPEHAFTFRFEVVQDAGVNAFAAPGGVVAVHTGLIGAAEGPDELAGVLAHEITHVLERHSMRQVVFAVGLSGLVQVTLGSPEGALGALASAASELSSLGFSRDQEREADEGALRLLERAQIPAHGLVSFFDRLKTETAPPAMLSSHPPAEDRATRLAEEIRKRGGWPVVPLGLDWNAVRAAAQP
jgi:hypothetical protein